MVSEFLQYTSYAFYVTLPTAGILLNCYVLSKLIKVARRSGSRFETTSGLPLSAMSISDSICLLATLSQFLFHFAVASTKDPSSTSSNAHLSFMCKIDLFMMHSTSGFSVWCWLFLSILRYIAVFHPLKYRTIWKQPRYALKSLAIVCLTSEVWILFFVIYDSKQRSCREDERYSVKQVKIAHMTDIFLFYALPSALRLIFDTIVLLRCYSCHSFGIQSPVYDRRLAISAPSIDRKTPSFDLRSLPASFSKSANSSFELDSCDGAAGRHAQLVLVASITTIQRRASTTVVEYSTHYTSRSNQSKVQALTKRRTAMILRSLVISAINLMCNLPLHIHRAYNTMYEFDQTESTNEEIKKESSAGDLFEQVAQLLYFSQFACNVFYLSNSIYETSLPPTRNAPISTIGRQISRCESRDGESAFPAVKRQISQPTYLQAHHPMLGDVKRQSSHPERLDTNRHSYIRRQASQELPIRESIDIPTINR